MPVLGITCISHFARNALESGNPKPLELFTPKDGLYEIRGAKTGERMPVRIITTQHRGFGPLRLVTSLLDPELFPRDVRPGRGFERDTQKRRAGPGRSKLQALEAKKHAAQRIGIVTGTPRATRHHARVGNLTHGVSRNPSWRHSTG